MFTFGAYYMISEFESPSAISICMSVYVYMYVCVCVCVCIYIMDEYSPLVHDVQSEGGGFLRSIYTSA